MQVSDLLGLMIYFIYINSVLIIWSSSPLQLCFIVFKEEVVTSIIVDFILKNKVKID